MRSVFSGIAIGVVATILLAIAVWLTVAYTGSYNVAASDPHADAVRWTLDTTMHRSVERRSGDVELPETFPDDLVAEGAGGAPGQDPTDWSRGMRPEPPHLVEAAAEWSAREIYWIVENGLKMSGMPAFGAHHGPQEIAALTAFVSQLPELSPQDYAALTGDVSAAGAGGTPAEVSPPAEETDGAGAEPAAADAD